MVILKMIDVEYRYKDRNRYILKNINIEFEKGKIYVVTGKSDSDKSVLLGILSGLDNCTNGSIIYKNNDLKAINMDIYRSSYIGAIFKDYNLIENTTVLNNMLLRININKEKSKIKVIHDILEIVGVDKNTLYTRVEDLTDEDKKKIYIAKALCNNPDIIISDDIIEDCDDRTAQFIIEIFIELAHKYNKCVIISTNSYEFASNADELWGMNNGQLIYIRGR